MSFRFVELSSLTTLLNELLHLEIFDVDQPLELINLLLQASSKVRVILFNKVYLTLVNTLQLGFQAIELEFTQPLQFDKLLLEHLILRTQETVAFIQILLELLLFDQQRLDLLVLGTQRVLEPHVFELDGFEVG